MTLIPVPELWGRLHALQNHLLLSSRVAHIASVWQGDTGRGQFSVKFAEEVRSRCVALADSKVMLMVLFNLMFLSFYSKKQAARTLTTVEW